MRMSDFWKIALGAGLAIFASNGFWSFIMSVFNIETAEKRMLKGLAHDRILYLCDKYQRRGDWITYEEYDNLYTYLYLPYIECKGNGTAQKAMKEVQDRLRIVNTPPADYKSPC